MGSWAVCSGHLFLAGHHRENLEEVGLIGPVNLDLVENLEQSIAMSGIDLDGAEFETNVIGHGEQLELTAKFNAEATTIDGRNDLVTPQFKFRTSHNRTWANNGMMGYFRSACYNTLVDGNIRSLRPQKHKQLFVYITY